MAQQTRARNCPDAPSQQATRRAGHPFSRPQPGLLTAVRTLKSSLERYRSITTFSFPMTAAAGTPEQRNHPAQPPAACGQAPARRKCSRLTVTLRHMRTALDTAVASTALPEAAAVWVLAAAYVLVSSDGSVCSSFVTEPLSTENRSRTSLYSAKSLTSPPLVNELVGWLVRICHDRHPRRNPSGDGPGTGGPAAPGTGLGGGGALGVRLPRDLGDFGAEALCCPHAGSVQPLL